MNNKSRLTKIKLELERLLDIAPENSEDEKYIKSILTQIEDIILNKNTSDEMIDAYCTFYNKLSIVLLSKILNVS